MIEISPEITVEFPQVDTEFMRIIPGDLDDARLRTLLQTHLARARAETAAGSAHALDLEGLRAPDIELWTVWEGEDLLAVGALKRLGPDHGEVKSMHTAEGARRRGAGSAVLRHLIARARAGGLRRLSLETGSWAYFEPAHALYRRHGFTDCPPFPPYAADPASLFLTLDLASAAPAPARGP